MAERFVRTLPICDTLDPVTASSITKIIMFKTVFSVDTSYIYIDEDDDVFSMGDNPHGCLGLGDEGSRSEPVAIKQLCKQHVKSIAFGWGGHMLAVTEYGTFIWITPVVDGELPEALVLSEPRKSGNRFNVMSCFCPVLCLILPGGRLFSWGYNEVGQVGNGNCNNVLIPVRVTTNLQDKKIVQAVCGSLHSMALSDEGEIFAWGCNNFGQLGSGSTENQSSPQRVNLEKAVSIACGAWHFVALLGNGEVYGWGWNRYGQLGLGNTDNQRTPCKVEALSGVVIKQIVCGLEHTLALSEDGCVFSWGRNTHGQLGTGDTNDLLSPHRINSEERFIEIAACHCSNTSAGLTMAGRVFMWGKCDGKNITSPLLTEASTTDEIFVLFSGAKSTWRMYSVEPDLNETKMIQLPGAQLIFKKYFISIVCVCGLIDRTKTDLSVNFSGMKLTNTVVVGSDIAKSFDDSTTTDITFIAEGREIYCHKAILKIRCEHFRSMFQSHWDEDNKDSIEVSYPYHVYRAFLYFLYTDSVDLCPEGAIGLLELANCYCEQILKNKCEQVIKQGITVENAAMLYAAAIKFGAKELEDFCFKFALDNMTKVTQTQSFAQLDESTHRNFFLKVSKAGAFKT